jgi:hypothetical protein
MGLIDAERKDLNKGFIAFFDFRDAWISFALCVI